MKRGILLFLIVIFLVGCSAKPSVQVAPQQVVIEQQSSEAQEPQNIKEISVTAKQFSFEPNPIVVSKGDKVRLSITSQDVTHGFSINDYNINVQVPPGKITLVEFLADKAGTFEIKCSVVCGSGHSAMRGSLIVQ